MQTKVGMPVARLYVYIWRTSLRIYECQHGIREMMRNFVICLTKGGGNILGLHCEQLYSLRFRRDKIRMTRKKDEMDGAWNTDDKISNV